MKYVIAGAVLFLGCASSTLQPKETGIGSGGSNADIDGFLVAPDFGTMPLDLGGGWGGGGGGGNPDLATPPSSNPDLATPPSNPDLATPPMKTKTGCHGEIGCVNACAAGDSACETSCRNNTTSGGDQKFQNLIDCINVDCPGVFSTDPCYNASSTKCSNCVQSSQMNFCAPELTACDADAP